MMVLVIGASGLIGGQLMVVLKEFWEIAGTFKTHPEPNLLFADISRKDSIRHLFRSIKPTVVCLVAALADIERCEENPSLSFDINVMGARNIAELCQTYHSKLVYLSTDYIFDGYCGPYSETDFPGPINTYGCHKLQAEETILGLCPMH